MLKITLMVLVAIAVVFVVAVVMQPSKFRIARTATMAAPAEAVFAQVNDFHNWEAWSPWAKLDPAAKNAYEGAPAGPGAVFRWSGNNEIGEGSTTIIDSRPNELIRIKLDFLKPFKATNTVEFSFKPEGGGTAVTWSMFGTNNFIGKAVGLFMDCEKMVGGQYEQGLAQLKAVVEGAPNS